MDPPIASTPLTAANTSCNACYSRLFELKRLAMKYMMIESHKMIVGACLPAVSNYIYLFIYLFFTLLYFTFYFTLLKQFQKIYDLVS